MQHEVRHFEGNELFRQSSDALPDPMVVLNAQRQVVFGNRAFFRFCEKDQAEILGCRFGEILACENAHTGSDGCGTSPQCVLCGALQTVLKAQQLKLENQGRCHMMLRNGDTLELDVQATPYPTEIGEFVQFNFREVGESNRLKTMERTFFHDLLNTASALHGVARLLEEEPGDKELTTVGSHLAEEIIEEILSHRTLLASESGELAVNLQWINLCDLLRNLQEFFIRHEVAHGKHLRIDCQHEDVLIETDPALLRRVLVNMVKNGLEASASGESVTLRFYRDGEGFVCEVHNAAVMPPEVQQKLFAPSFSTKGSERGFGTHSMRILSEKYLGGRIDFSSKAGEGTVFRLVLPREITIAPTS